MEDVKIKKIIRFIIIELCVVVSVLFVLELIDNFKNWIKPGTEYKVVENNEEEGTLYYSLVIDGEEFKVVSPEDYIYNNVTEGNQIKNAFICESIRDILKFLILLIVIMSSSKLVDSLLFGESLQKNFSNFFKNIAIMCFVYVLVPSLVYLILAKEAFVHGIFYDTCFIFILGCVITIAYFVHKRGISVKSENDLIA